LTKSYKIDKEIELSLQYNNPYPAQLYALKDKKRNGVNKFTLSAPYCKNSEFETDVQKEI